MGREENMAKDGYNNSKLIRFYDKKLCFQVDIKESAHLYKLILLVYGIRFVVFANCMISHCVYYAFIEFTCNIVILQKKKKKNIVIFYFQLFFISILLFCKINVKK